MKARFYKGFSRFEGHGRCFSRCSRGWSFALPMQEMLFFQRCHADSYNSRVAFLLPRAKPLCSSGFSMILRAGFFFAHDHRQRSYERKVFSCYMEPESEISPKSVQKSVQNRYKMGRRCFRGPRVPKWSPRRQKTSRQTPKN